MNPPEKNNQIGNAITLKTKLFELKIQSSCKKKSDAIHRHESKIIGFKSGFELSSNGHKFTKNRLNHKFE